MQARQEAEVDQRFQGGGNGPIKVFIWTCSSKITLPLSLHEAIASQSHIRIFD